MLITDKNELTKYYTGRRIWQGIPSIAVTRGGRIFCTFYSGGITEEIGNFVVLVKSDDGENFSEPIAVCYKENHRCFDPCLWIDPQDRLWLTWSCMMNDGVYGAICENPDADELSWSAPFPIGQAVMMNKPTVLSSGEWLFPIAVWPKFLQIEGYCASTDPIGAHAYKSVDNGKTFERLDGPVTENGFFDEHMILEFNDDRLGNFIRTCYGIGVSYSYDRGKTWTPTVDTGYGGPNSRFHIRRLKSGRILLINHYNFVGRNNLTAMLSEDEGKTWKYKLLLDSRNVSYPDAQETDDGFIHITYDFERGGYRNSIEEAYSEAREILYAKITEEDIIAGKLVNPESKLKVIISKLGKYELEHENPFGEKEKYSDVELAKLLINDYPNKIAEKLFEFCPADCMAMQKLSANNLDKLLAELELNPQNAELLVSIISLLRSVSNSDNGTNPLVERVKDVILNDRSGNITTQDIADRIGISRYYMLHQFKKATGITVTDYKNHLRLTTAKKMLVESDKSITDIASECGFCSASYFAEVFMRYEKISPTEYREYLKK